MLLELPASQTTELLITDLSFHSVLHELRHYQCKNTDGLENIKLPPVNENTTKLQFPNKYTHTLFCCLTSPLSVSPVVPNSATVSVSQDRCSIEARRQGAYAIISVSDPSWQHAVPSQEQCHPSMLWHCCLGDRKGIWPVKSTTTTIYNKYMIVKLPKLLSDDDFEFKSNRHNSLPKS